MIGVAVLLPESRSLCYLVQLAWGIVRILRFGLYDRSKAQCNASRERHTAHSSRKTPTLWLCPIVDYVMASQFRCVVEVLRFLPTKDTLRTASILSSTWLKAVDNDELWRDYCDSFGIDCARIDCISLKTHFKCSYGESKLLPIVTATSLLLYSVPSLEEKIVVLSKTVSADRFTAYCFLSQRTLMASGARANTADAYKIAIDIGEVTDLSPMCIARHSAPLFKYQRIVYCFAGCSGSNSLTSIERYSIVANSWTVTPHEFTSARSGMTPTRYRTLLYIPGSSDIDVFDLQTEEVRPFPLRLPQAWHYCLACATPVGELVVIQREQVMRCSLLQIPSHFRIHRVKIVDNGNYWSNCPVVRVGTSLFSVQNTHGKIERILVFDLLKNTLQVSKELNVIG